MDISRFSLYALWAVVLVNLVLMVRILAWLRVIAGIRPAPTAPPTELRVGTTAPAFLATTLTGERVTEQTYEGRRVMFVFLSPECSTCRGKLAVLHKIGAAAGRAGVATVLVLDVGPGRARSWLESVEHEDGVQVVLPVLLAPISRNPFVPSYSAGYFPYFCLVDGDGTVLARGFASMEAPEWRAVVAQWIPPPAASRERADRPQPAQAASGTGQD